jgi:AcrR family transcriptional regulator
VTDARIVRTTQAIEHSVVHLAARKPISHVTVAEVCEEAGVTRRTFYNRFSSPQQVLVQVLQRDLADLASHDADRRATANGSSEVLLRLANADIVDHVLRHNDIYRQALTLSSDARVFDVLVNHFADYALAFVRRVPGLDLTSEGIDLVAQFLAHGFAGAIRTWLSNPATTRDDLEKAAVMVAPSWWA